MVTVDANFKEVNFHVYCKTCKHHMKHGYETPCNDCLEVPMREGTEKPEYWEAK